MDIVECIDQFLDSKGLVWFNRDVYNPETDLITKAKEDDFKDAETKTLLLCVKNNRKYGAVTVVVTVNLLDFKLHGIEFDSTFNAYLEPGTPEYEMLDEEKDLSSEWIDFLTRKKGLVYKLAAQKEIEKRKNLISNKSHEKILRLIKEINKTTEDKNKVFEHYDSIISQIEESL